MERFDYYQKLKQSARQIRTDHGLNTPRVLKSDLRRIYKALGVCVDLWPPAGDPTAAHLKNLRGAYFSNGTNPCVMVSRHLPDEPLIFTMGHELKHHLFDSDLGVSYCDESNEHDAIEIGAEIFAAELIFPEGDFVAWLGAEGIDHNNFKAETLVHMKRKSQTTMSYTALVKRSEYLQYVLKGSFSSVKWKLLEERIYGEPIYKRIIRRRALWK